MSLTVCLLTRNEEALIARAIASVAGMADEVVVADTGSTDGTARIAAAGGARVIKFAWDDDFAAGRNFVLRHASSDWVLFMNADEELLAAAGENLQASMSLPGTYGYFVRLQQVNDPARPDCFIETADLRLFRRRPGLRFVGRLHPALTRAYIEVASAEGLRIEASGVTLRRHAYLSRLDNRKTSWMLRLLERELADRPGQLHYLIEYGRTLLLAKDPRGHAVLAEAAAKVAACRNAPTAPSHKVQVLLEYLLDSPGSDAARRIAADEARQLALRWFPNSPRLLYQLAEQSFKAGDAAAAAALLERLLELGRTGTYDRSQSFDPGRVGDDATMNLAACYRRLGRLTDAEQCYRLLAHSRHFQKQAGEGLAAVQALRGRGSVG